MAQERIAQDRAYDIADAENVLVETKKHFSKMEPLGASLARVRAYEGTIAEAKGLEKSSGRISLDKARRELKDRLGRYRKRADIAANGFDGPNEKLARALRCGGEFPRNDATLTAAVEGIGDVLKSNAAVLAKVEFGPKEQDGLIKAAAAFIAERTAKPTLRGKQQAESTQRDRVFEMLRYQTGWFRRVGLEALEGEAAANSFHRVKVAPKAKKAVPPPPAMEKEG